MTLFCIIFNYPKIKTISKSINFYKMKTFRLGILTAVFAIAAFSCKEDDIRVSDVKFDREPPYTIEAGETMTVTAKVVPANHTDKKFTVTSDKPAIATAEGSAQGSKVTVTVRGVSPGKARITVTHVQTGISDGADVFVVAPNVAVSSVTVSPKTLSLTAGEKQTLSATVLPAEATNKTVAWTSNAAAIASVNATTGEVTAVAAGTATITATADGKSDACTVTVTAATVAVESVTVVPNTLSLKVGEVSQKLSATVLPENATNPTVTWESALTAVAEVVDGVVTAKAAGTTKITATADGKSGECTVTVTAAIIPVESVTIVPNTLSLKVGEVSPKLSVTVLPTDATNPAVIWTTENAAVATVADGVVTAAGVGTVKIIATADGKSGECTVTVTPVVVESVTVNPNTLALKVGEVSSKLSTTVLPPDATNPAVTWTTNAPAVATVADGVVTATGVGTATITATADGKSGDCTVTVTVPDITLTVTGTYTYTGNPIVPTVTVKAGDMTLPASDYDLSCSNNLDAGVMTATVTATGKGMYAGKSDTKNFTVAPRAATLTVTVADGTYTYKKAQHTPSITVVWNGMTLTATKDFTITYGVNINAGAGGVIVTGAGNFAGSTGTGNFTIEKCKISVTANPQEKTWWDADPALTYTVSPPLYSGDALTGAPTRAPGANVGKYEITQGTLAGGVNYEIIDFTGSSFEIYWFKGDGTSAETAYEISRAEMLAKLAELVNASATNSIYGDKYYKLTADINLNNAAWTPIGTQTYTFKGTFDGNKHKVSGLYINYTTAIAHCGLFGRISGGTVQNLGVEGAVTTSGNYVGGIVGSIYDGTITNCYSSVAVIASSGTVGGIAGLESNSKISNCYATGSVSGTTENFANFGGLVGQSSSSTLSNCYATGTVRGFQVVGGLFGQGGGTSNCAALNPSLTRSHGTYTNYGRISGVVGANVINNVAWEGMIVIDAPVTNGTANNLNGADITTAQAKDQATYTGLGWSFDGNNDASPWKMGVGNYELPVFYWQTTAPAPMPEHLK